MSDVLNECPECGTFDTDRQMLDWLRDGVDIVYTCDDCGIEFVTSLRRPLKEVTHTPEKADPA